jgi:hypothetical protein
MSTRQRITRILTLGLILVGTTLPAPFAKAQSFAVITGSNTGDGTGSGLVQSGNLCFAPRDINGNPMGVRASGQMTTRPVCVAIQNGVISPVSGTFQIANTTGNVPSPFCWNVTLTDKQTGLQLYADQPYKCVQMDSSWCSTVSSIYTCNWDLYIPNSPAQAPVVALSLAAGAITTLSPGSSVTANVHGTSPNFLLDLGIPAGANGATGPPITFLGPWSNPTACTVGQSVSLSGNSFVAITGSTGVSPPASCISTATWGALACAGSAGAGLLPAGNIFSAASFPSLPAGFVASAATPTIVSNALSFAGLGSSIGTQSYDYNYSTTLPVWSLTCRIIVGTRAGTAQDIGCGMRSIESLNAFTSLVAYLDTSTGLGTSGLFYLYEGGSSQQQTTVPMAFSAGDTLSLTVTRNQDTVTATINDVTTNGGPISLTGVSSFAYGARNFTLPNIGHFAMFAAGATPGSISAFSVSTSQPAGIKYAVVGDSKGVGYYADSYQGTWPQLLSNTYGYPITQFAGGGDSSLDMVRNLPEIIAYRPSVVFLECCSNDVRNSVAIGTIETNYANVVSTLTAAGIQVYELLSFVENSGINQAPLDAWISATYPTTSIANTGASYLGTPSSILAADNIHPNAFYHGLIAAQINQFLFPSGLNVNVVPYRSTTLLPYNAFATHGLEAVINFTRVT